MYKLAVIYGKTYKNDNTNNATKMTYAKLKNHNMMVREMKQ